MKKERSEDQTKHSVRFCNVVQGQSGVNLGFEKAWLSESWVYFCSVLCCYRDAADLVVQGKGKFEELMVCSHEIAASTAQLVAASKVSKDQWSLCVEK